MATDRIAGHEPAPDGGPGADISAAEELARTDRAWLNQARFDALSAKHLHDRRSAHLRRRISIADILALAVPVGYFPVRYVVGEESVRRLAEVAWMGLAIALAAMALARLVFRWPDRAAGHADLRARNSRVGGQIQDVLDRGDGRPLIPVGLRRTVERLNDDDAKALGGVGTRERRYAYREALKEAYDGATATCPECGESPWGGPTWSPRRRCDLCGRPAPAHRQPSLRPEEAQPS